VEFPGATHPRRTAARCADGQSCVEGRGQTLARDVADIKPDGAVGKHEIVEIVSANLCDGLKFMRNEDGVGMKRLAWKHGSLDDAGFLEFLLTDFFASEEFRQSCGSDHRCFGKGGNSPGGRRRQSKNSGKEWRRRENREVLLTTALQLWKSLWRGGGYGQTQAMRALALVLVAAGILYAVYNVYLKKMPTTDAGTAVTQAISLTGVRSDLLQIAQAERTNMALNGKCSSLDELISSGAMAMSKRGRDGYTYEINCSGPDFQIVAEHPPALEGSGIRFPKLAIDAGMRIQEIQ